MDTASAPPNTNLLLDSKLRPPILGDQIISRVEQITHAGPVSSCRPITTLVAPAGSGKSTLMAELQVTFEQQGWFAFWYSLDADDDDPSIFARYFTSAVYPLDSSVADKELRFLQAYQQKHLGFLVDSLIVRLCAEQRNFAIFVDDFQCLSHPQILRFWNRLVAHMPPNLKLVIASRSNLPLDLSRRRLSGSVFELGQQALNFKTDQISVFMQQNHSISLQAETAELLYSTTEGWVAGLQMVALAINRGQGDVVDLIRDFSGRDKELTEYLLQTVFAGLADDVKQFLLETSPVASLSPSLCDAVTRRAGSRRMLEYLEHSNLFLIPLDRQGEWYRYHHLFADFLRNKIKRENHDRYVDACERAAQWYEGHERLTEAVQYYLAAKNFVKATDLIAERAPDVAQYTGDHHTILDWMRRLPAAYHDKRPELLLSHAWSRAFSRDTEQAIKLADQVLAGLQHLAASAWVLNDNQRQHFQWLAKVTKVIATAAADDAERCIETANVLLEKLPNTEPTLQGSASNALAYGYLMVSRAGDAAAAAANAYSAGKRSGSVYVTAWADFLAGRANLEMGRVNQATEYAERAMENVGPCTGANTYVCGLAALVKAEVEAQRCDFFAAAQSLALGQSFSRILGPPDPLLVALRGEARLKAWKGELGEARKVLHHGQDMALGTDLPRLYFALAAEEIDLQLRYDSLEAAQDTVRRSNILDVKHPLISRVITRPVEELRKITRARLLLAKGENKTLLACLSRLEKMVSRERASLQLTLKTIRAAALWRLGREADSVRELDRVLAEAAPERNALPIVGVGSALLEVLEAMLAARSAVFTDSVQEEKWAFVARLIGLLRGEEPHEAVATKASEEIGEIAGLLTERELEILKLVRAGLGNKQLATELFLSVSTVKWHLHNVYGKLGVRNRMAAAAYAANQRLI